MPKGVQVSFTGNSEGSWKYKSNVIPTILPNKHFHSQQFHTNSLLTISLKFVATRSDQKPIEFDAFSKLPEPLVPSSIQVMKYAGAYVKLEIDKDTNKDKRWFDWNSFKTSVDDYKGDDLTFDKYKNTTIASSESKVSTMVEKIVKFLVEALSVVLDENAIKSLSATIETTFTSLKEKSSNGFLDFSKSNDGHNSSWEYRIQFAFPNQDLPNYFYTLVTTIKLEADVSNESEWWGLVGSSSKNFSATIDAMELVVMKGFKNPN